MKKRTLNPVFNESFVFELPAGTDSLAGVRLEFMLLDWDRVTKNEVSVRRRRRIDRTHSGTLTATR